MNSTFSGNSVGTPALPLCGRGGGISNLSTSMATVTHSTFSGNSADCGNFTRGGGIYNKAELTLGKTILANSPNGGNCFFDDFFPSARVTDEGYNVEDADTCGFTRATGSLPDTDPLLDPDGLSDNGGPTQTIALQPDSPAVDLVGQGACPPPATDQRGVKRPQGESCDSGAFELVQQPPKPPTKEECKKGGYKEFGFKNQGRCIAFVNSSARDQ
jgi:hypothetical protein